MNWGCDLSVARMIVKDIVRERKAGRGVGEKAVPGLLTWQLVGCLFFLCVLWGGDGDVG